MFKWHLFFWLLLFNPSVYPVVFYCEMLDGAILYQDLPCNMPCAVQEILTIRTRRLPAYDPSSANTTFNKLSKKRNYSSNKKKMKLKKDGSKKIHRNNDNKLKVIAQNKIIRRKQRCNDIKIKLQLLHNRLRPGYTARKELKINEQLIHYTNLKEKYCD